jgi:hypothetical protein
MTARKENGIWLVSEVIDVNRYDFYGSAEELKANIDLVVEKALKMGMTSYGVFNFELERGYYDDDYELKFTYSFHRMENEKEKAAREKLEAKHKEAAADRRKAAAEARKLKKDAEYAEYLRLKEKFKEV